MKKLLILSVLCLSICLTGCSFFKHSDKQENIESVKEESDSTEISEILLVEVVYGDTIKTYHYDLKDFYSGTMWGNNTQWFDIANDNEIYYISVDDGCIIFYDESFKPLKAYSNFSVEVIHKEDLYE